MPETESSKSYNWTGKVISSSFVGWFMNLPPIAWLVRKTAQKIVAQQVGDVKGTELIDVSNKAPSPPVEEGVAGQIIYPELQSSLDNIACDVVHALGYVGAMVATYEQGDALPVRAFYVDPAIATKEQIHQWEVGVSKWAKESISITNPEVARVYRYQEKYAGNLSIRAAESGKSVVSKDLYDLFTPIAPPASKPFVGGIQDALGIKQVIAVPFFIGDEMVGNLFAAKPELITNQDLGFLTALARQAAAAILSERRSLRAQVAQELIYLIQANIQHEDVILRRIVEGIVSDLGYVSAIVATHEQDGSLPVRAFHVDPKVASKEQILSWESEITERIGSPVSIFNPDIARVYRHQDKYKDNLSIRTAETGSHITSNELYDLLMPVVPLAAKPLVQGVQDALGINQLIAIPFYSGGELVGNLFAATRSKTFRAGEVEALTAFGQQAALGIRNARLYRKSEERRLAAQIFARMAFSAATSVHDLRNHIGVVRGQLGLIERLESVPPDTRKEIIDSIPKLLTHLTEASNILEILHQPWRHTTIDQLTDPNQCISDAISKVLPVPNQINMPTGKNLPLELHKALSQDIPEINTIPKMLTEAFKVIIKNAVEAMQDSGKPENHLWIESSLQDNWTVFKIRDTGTGIRPEDQSKIFDMSWTTKGERGMGFGLFWTRDYIEGLNGKIVVDSVWTEGTTITLMIPKPDSSSK